MRGMSTSGLSGGSLAQAERAAGDVDRVIADALEIVRDLERGGDESQIAGHRLLQRQQRDAALVDLDLEPVDDVVVVESPRGPAPGRGACSASMDFCTMRSARPPIRSRCDLSASSS